MTSKPLVLVRWNDATGSLTKNLTEADDSYHKPEVMQTVGWLLRSDTRGVSICNEVYLDDGVPHYRGHTFVPRGMVVTVKRLKA